MPSQLTRRELYDLVWSKPVTQVAMDLGVSGVAVKKICDRHRIPVPGRGYWAKVAAGQKVKTAAFRDIAEPTLNIIRVHGSLLKSLPNEVLQAREKAEATQQAPRAAPLTFDGDIGRTHPLVEELKKKLAAGKPGHDGLVSATGKKTLVAKVAPQSTERALSILNGLIVACTAQGVELVSGESGLCASSGEDAIDLELVEGTDRIKHEPTATELAAVERFDATQERARLRGQWISSYDRPRIPEWDWKPNGRLSLLVDKNGRSDGIRRKFADGSRQRLESLIDDVAVALVTCAAARKARREERERWERDWAERQTRQRDLERRQRLDKRRWEFLEKQVDLAERADRVESFIAAYAMQHKTDDIGVACQRLLEWGSGYISRLRRRIAPSHLEFQLNKYALMDDNADIGDWVKFAEQED